MKKSNEIKSKFDAAAWLIASFYSILLTENEKAEKIRNVKENNFEEAANCRAREIQMLEAIPAKEEFERVIKIALS